MIQTIRSTCCSSQSSEVTASAQRTSFGRLQTASSQHKLLHSSKLRLSKVASRSRHQISCVAYEAQFSGRDEEEPNKFTFNFWGGDISAFGSENQQHGLGEFDSEFEKEAIKRVKESGVLEVGKGDEWGGMDTLWWTELDVYKNAPCVYVLLFGVGTTQEGVYSLQRRTNEGLPEDTVLAFATKADADCYAALLQAEMGRVAHAEALIPEDLEEFCQGAGFQCRVVGQSAVTLGLFTPPKYTVEMTDWERASRLRKGLWSVLGDEAENAEFPGPFPGASCLGSGAAGLGNKCPPSFELFDELNFDEAVEDFEETMREIEEEKRLEAARVALEKLYQSDTDSSEEQ